MPHIGLCMIVRNEAPVIERCLRSVAAFVDHWTIVDTGSTDGTQDLVRALLADVPGTLVERPWVDFGHNRTEALELARPHADYTFLIDADETFLPPAGFDWPELGADAYHLRYEVRGIGSWRRRLIANRLPWTFDGIVYEQLAELGERTVERLAGPAVREGLDGVRHRGVDPRERYRLDAGLLAESLATEPGHPTRQFMLAQCLRAAGEGAEALRAFRTRVELGGAAEETAQALLAIARLLEGHADPDVVVGAYMRAWESQAVRAEALTDAARFCRAKGRYDMARLFARQAADLPRPEGSTWVEEATYAWGALDELATCSYLAGDYAGAADAGRRLLASPHLPEAEQPRIAENLRCALAELGEPAPRAPLNADPLAELLRPGRRTAIVEVDALSAAPVRSYGELLSRGLCTVVGFVADAERMDALRNDAGPSETYLPYGHAFGAVPALSSVHLLRIAAPGLESAILRGAQRAAAQAVAVHTNVSLASLYDPANSALDVELRSTGFLPFVLEPARERALRPTMTAGVGRRASRLAEDEIVYLRDPARCTAEQLKHLALLAHHLYGAHDLALACVETAAALGAIDADAPERYRAQLGLSSTVLCGV